MRKSGNKNGFTKVDHVTFDLILPMLSTAAQSVLLRIYRQTLGWHKQTDRISLRQFKSGCNIKRHETISSALDELLGLKLITAVGKGTQVKEFGIKFETLDMYRRQYMENLDYED